MYLKDENFLSFVRAQFYCLFRFLPFNFSSLQFNLSKLSSVLDHFLISIHIPVANILVLNLLCLWQRSSAKKKKKKKEFTICICRYGGILEIVKWEKQKNHTIILWKLKIINCFSVYITFPINLTLLFFFYFFQYNTLILIFFFFFFLLVIIVIEMSTKDQCFKRNQSIKNQHFW